MSLTFQPPGDVQPVTSMHLQERTLKDVAISHAREEIGEATYDARNWQFFPGASGTISRVDLTIILSIKMPVWDNYRARPRQEMQE